MKTNFDEMEKKLEGQSRRRRVTLLRFFFNIKSPVNLAFAVLIVVLGYIASSLVKIPFPGDNATFPILIEIWNSAIMFFFIVLSFLFAIMVLIMPPDQAKDMENDLKHIPLIDSYGFAPALLSNQKKKSSQESSEAQRLVFYSKGIEKKKWIDQQTAIEDELNVHYLEDPDYLELLRFRRKKIVHRHYIVLIVSQGVESRREEPLYADEP